MKSKRSKWLVVLIAMVFLSVVVAGCANTSDVEKPDTDKPGEVAEKVTITDIADKYYAEMPEHIYKIDSKDLKERLDANDERLLVVDIRGPEAYAKGHIAGAVNVPFAQVHEYLDKLPVDKELMVCCVTGQTAGQTVAIMNMYGYNARSVNLGFDKGWVGQYNYPAETTINELPANVTPAKPDPAIAEILKNYYANMKEDIYKIGDEELNQMIENGDDIQVVDIRGAEAFNAGHIPTAINIPFGEVNKHFDEFAKDKPVYICCVTGQTAGQTVAVLNTLGIDAKSVNAGFDLGWEPAGLPIEK